MKPPAFDYQRPHDIDEALDLLDRHDGDAKVLAGGQSLVPMMNMRLALPAVLVDINHIDGLTGISADNGEIVLGALTRHRDAELSSVLAQAHPVLAEAASNISHVTIRNWGTVAGSLAHCDPAAEWATVGLATDLQVVARSQSGERRISISDLLVGPFTTTLEENELLTEIRIPRPAVGSGAAFVEFSRIHGNFAIASVCTSVIVNDGEISAARIALGGVAATAVAMPEAETLLVGGEPSEELFARAGAAVMESVDPGTDVQATGDYRRQLAGALVERCLVTATERASNDYGRTAQ